MKRFFPFAAGLSAGLLVWLTVSGLNPKPTAQVLAVGNQAGLPSIEPGEFRVTLSDCFLSTKMTEEEYLILTNVFHRARIWRNHPPTNTATGVGGYRLAR